MIWPFKRKQAPSPRLENARRLGSAVGKFAMGEMPIEDALALPWGDPVFMRLVVPKMHGILKELNELRAARAIAKEAA